MISLTVGLIGIAVTVALHAIATSLIALMFRSYAIESHARIRTTSRPLIIGVIAVGLAIKHYLDMFLWACAYWALARDEHFESFSDALYLSSVTYTSLGYGDLTLTGDWRLICGIQAMNGIMLFGWSTALLFFIVQRFWAEEANHIKAEQETDTA